MTGPDGILLLIIGLLKSSGVCVFGGRCSRGLGYFLLIGLTFATGVSVTVQ